MYLLVLNDGPRRRGRRTSMRRPRDRLMMKERRLKIEASIWEREEKGKRGVVGSWWENIVISWWFLGNEHNCVVSRLRCHPEVTSDHTKSNAHGVFPDENYRVWDLFRAHSSMIRGNFGLRSVWWEVTSVWGWYDQRSIRSGDDIIRGQHLGMGMVWLEAESSAN